MHHVPDQQLSDLWEVEFQRTRIAIGVRMEAKCGCGALLEVPLHQFKALDLRTQHQFGMELLIQGVQACDANHDHMGRLAARQAVLLAQHLLIKAWLTHVNAWHAEGAPCAPFPPSKD